MRKFIYLLAIIFCFISTLSIASADSINLSKMKHISYQEVGQGKILVLIHAFPTNQHLWKPQQEGLKKHFRVITLDLWGFGKSSPVDGKAMTMTDYADEVKQLFDQLHIKKAIIGGESMGGYIALAFYKKYPDKVDGLVLSDTQSIADSEEAKAKRESTALDVLEHGSANFINGFMPKALSPNVSEQVKEFLKQMIEKQTPNAIASALRGMALRDDTSDILASSLVLILIITGNQDMLISPQQSENMHALAKNSKLVVINDAGHLSSLEQPEKWNKAVIDMFF